MAHPTSVLVLGGTGYLGQFILQTLVQDGGFNVCYTYSQAGPLPTAPTCKAFKVGTSQHGFKARVRFLNLDLTTSRVDLPVVKRLSGRSCGEPAHSTVQTNLLTQADAAEQKPIQVDLVSGEGLEECLGAGPYVAVINCAAISSPAACESDPTSLAVNVPRTLLTALQQSGSRPLFLHLSTDQVYDGSRPWWKEEDACQPLNAYGRQKLQSEQLLQAEWPEHVILRSSLIYGPQSPTPVPRALFLQFVLERLRTSSPTDFFSDEYRCPVLVTDIAAAVLCFVHASARGESFQHRIFNMGEPERLSRVEMAQTIAKAYDLPQELIKSVPSASVKRPYQSPPDISMVSTRLWNHVGIEPKRLAEALKSIPL